MQELGAGLAVELREAPEAISRQAENLVSPLAALAIRLDRRPPDVVVTCARGSSAHAAAYAKHLFERHLGIPVAAAAPNVTAIYRRRLRLEGQLFLTISQSGLSDDLVETAIMARAAGALTVALVNDPGSPLATACEFVLPMAAGPELSVAATKTFVASLAALLRMSAVWTADGALLRCCDRLPQRLMKAGELDWSDALPALAGARDLVAIGRGPTLAVAREAALKLKETCAVHAEAFSSAEFRHGPIALVSPAYPILMFAAADESAAGISELADELARKDAQVLVAGPEAPKNERTHRLPVLAPDQADADAICLIQAFYALLVRLARQRGTDVDSPRHLQKVTRTR